MFLQICKKSILPNPLPNLVAKRFAGGGGRPGGRPAFTWKEKKQLGLDGKRLKPMRVNADVGLFEEIEPYFNPARGDKIVDITNLEVFEENPPASYLRGEEKPNGRTKIQVNRLFGSTKPFGTLPTMYPRRTFRGSKDTKKIFPKIKKVYVSEDAVHLSSSSASATS